MAHLTLGSPPRLLRAMTAPGNWSARLRAAEFGLPDLVLYVALALLFGATYLITLLPALHDFGDITKAQFVGRLLGTTHPPGYPLYNLLTWAVSWAPVGTLAQRINAFSAVCAVGTVLLLFHLQKRELGVGRWAAFGAAAAFGWSKTFWSQSVIAEVYTLNSLLVASILVLLLRWRRTGSDRVYLFACGLYALSFGNHLTVVTLLPTFLYAVFSSDRRVLRSPRLVLTVIGLIVLCASLYLYPLWRTAAGSPYLEYEIRSFDALVDYVTGERYRARMFAFSPGELYTKRLPRFVAQLFGELGVLAVLAPLGAWLCRPRYARATLLLAFVGQFGWVINYDIPDIEVYVIPVVFLAAVFVGVGLDALARTSWRGAAVTALASGALVLVQPAAHGRAVDHKKHVKFTARIDEELASLGRGAIVVGAIHYGPRMAYVHRLVAEGLGDQMDLHLAYTAGPKDVVDYLRGRGALRDAHSGQRLEPGRRVFISPRGEKADWGKAGVHVGPLRHGFRELSLLTTR